MGGEEREKEDGREGQYDQIMECTCVEISQ
jgi:hypothetical protein